MKKVLAFMALFVVCGLFSGCSATHHQHQLKFYVNDELKETISVEDGGVILDIPDAGEIPGYEFTGWDIDLKDFPITSDLDIHAKLNRLEYKVVFKDKKGDEITTEYAYYGEEVLPPKAPVIRGFKFTGWDRDLSNITCNMEVNPKYEEIVLTLSFCDIDDNLLEEIKMHGREIITLPTPPERKGYKFETWEPNYRKVEEDTVFHPVYTPVEYYIDYFIDDEKITDYQPKKYSIESDDEIILPVPPEKADAEFIGWDDYGAVVKSFRKTDMENKRFYAVYEKTVKPLEIPDDTTYMLPGIRKLQHSQDPGLYVYRPELSGLPESVASRYTWYTFDKKVAEISGTCTILGINPGYTLLRGVLQSNVKVVVCGIIRVDVEGVHLSSLEEAKEMCHVKFADSDGNIIKEEDIHKHLDAVPPLPLKVKGKTFIGWDRPLYNITEDCTFNPVYKDGESDFIGKKVSILGDSISTYKPSIPRGYLYFFPYVTSDFNDVNATWWMRTINDLGMTLHKNNSYSGSCVDESTGVSATSKMVRLRELLRGSERPDIIIINMGTNDCASKYVSEDSFKKSYGKMLGLIKKLCPDAEVYLMTLPQAKIYSTENQIKYNNIIKSFTDYKILDLEDLYPKDTGKRYLIDSAHPNYLGMEVIAERVKEELLRHEGITE